MKAEQVRNRWLRTPATSGTATRRPPRCSSVLHCIAAYVSVGRLFLDSCAFHTVRKGFSPCGSKAFLLRVENDYAGLHGTPGAVGVWAWGWTTLIVCAVWKTISVSVFGVECVHVPIPCLHPCESSI